MYLTSYGYGDDIHPTVVKKSISKVMNLPECRICYVVSGKEKRFHREVGIGQRYASWSCKEHMVPGSFCWKHNLIK